MDEPGRIVFRVPASGVLTELTFAPVEAGTKVTFHQTNVPAENQADTEAGVTTSLERLASLLLVLRPNYRVIAHNPYGMGWSMSKFRDNPHNAYINDALKMAFRELGYPQYMEAFNAMRNKFIDKG